jgi:hypothetical protein
MYPENQYKYCFFDTCDSILYHDVTEENFNNEESFINSMSQFITLIDKYCPRALIIRVYKEPRYFDQNLDSFMKSTFKKVATALNIQKIAFYIDEKKYMAELVKHSLDRNFKIHFFDNLNDAKNWVLSKD